MGSSPAVNINYPDEVPKQFGIGTTVRFTRTFSSFPASAWDYTIYWNGPAKFNQAAVAWPSPGATGFLIQVPADTTKSLLPGPYRYCERVTAKAQDDQGQIQVWDLTGDTLVTNVTPSAADSPANAFQSWEEQTIAVLQAAIAGDLSAGIQSYHVAGRAISKYSVKDLTGLLGYFKAIVWRKQHPGKLGEVYAVAFPMEPTAPPLPPTWVNITGIG
jgi:hypothetical protein